MRFLQTEWHRHERDRNAWEIEREEMKKRIAGLEGEARTGKGVRVSLEKHIKILETALKKERERVRALNKGDEIDVQRDPRDIAREELKASKGMLHLNSPGRRSYSTDAPPTGIAAFDTELESGNHLLQGVRQEKERDKSKSYLEKSSAEITYHVLPSSHVPPEMSDPLPSNNIFQGRQPSQQELQDAYIQLQQQKQQQYRNDIAMVRENAMPNNQHHNNNVPEPGLQRSATQINHSQLPVRERERKDVSQPMAAAVDTRKQFYNEQIPTAEDQVESVSHSYDSYGRQVLPPQDEGPREEPKVDIADGWDFDDGPVVTQELPPDSLLHRPDMEVFPSANQLPSKSPPRAPGSRRKSSGARRRSSESNDARDLAATKADSSQFKVRFAMRGHLDVVRTVIFTGGGSPSEPEFCTGSDDGGVKRWHIPASYTHAVSMGSDDLDRIAHFTHRGHVGAVCSLAACPPSPNFSNGGRVAGDGWIFSGGEDATVRVWERGRVDAKAILEGHKDAIWALCVLPGTASSILGDRCNQYGGPDRVLLASGGADGTILIWAVSQPPQLTSPHAGSNRGTRGSRRANSISAGSNFPSSPQPSVASNTPFHYTLVHRIERADNPAPTSISPLSPDGTSFVVSYTDASVLVFDTRTGEEIVGMASLETYDGTPNTGVNAVVASSTGFDTAASVTAGRRGSIGEDDVVHGATGSEGGVEGVVIAGYEDRFIRFFDANSGKFLSFSSSFLFLLVDLKTGY
jgi:striatin 1/3/4